MQNDSLKIWLLLATAVAVGTGAAGAALHAAYGHVSPAPSPGPDPGPKPPAPTPIPPGPPKPPAPGKYGVATVVYEATMKLAAADKAKAPELAKAFVALQSAINAKTVTLKTLSSETLKALDGAVGDSKAAYRTILNAAYAKLKPQVGTDLGKISEAYGEIADGFAAVR